MASPVKASAAQWVPAARSVTELARRPVMREALQWFGRERLSINEQHLQLCRVPAPTFFEQHRAEWMVAQFRQIGCEAKLDRAGNVVAHLDGRDSQSPGRRYIALTAHLDTVLAPRSAEEITVRPDGTLRGPGVSDNGAGLAGLLAIARCAKVLGCLPPGEASLLLVANVGEEGEGNLSGMRYLCRQSSLAGRIRAFVVLDGPTTDHITHQALASRRFEISYCGNGGHSWSDFGNGNPVHALSRAISLFTDQAPEVSSAISPRASFNFGLMDGGTSINSIPASARAKLDLRSESPRKIDEMSDLLTASVDRALQVENERSAGGRLTAKIREIGSRPGGMLPESAPLLQYLRAVDSHLGIRSHLDCASTDANIPLSMNQPALSIGAGGQGGGAHTPSEWFHPEGREVGLQRILLTLAMLLQEE